MKFIQSVIGVFLGTIVLVAGVSGIAYLMLRDLITPPERPVFANEPDPQQEAEIIPAPPAVPYDAVVIYENGLLLRDRPAQDATTLVALEFREAVEILEFSDDQKWQRVRAKLDNQEGWVSAGNTQRAE
ncbi:SH3 domain-containing protein [Synechococcales cyanobacterium C]|uniref:SH3 domain-containing protein n=1 Tax=Petrachloros mirabilis ULC683 TaxID=2781853 RepID=A0A8K1ZVN4_9CYAN|nr:SH3 domain-containing protein [Petrachloros mirabilis]NCJ05969.1 SH3 domain-containing protein [Petrachloros mirabilis ULC683]